MAGKARPGPVSSKSHIGPPALCQDVSVLDAWLAGTLTLNRFLKKCPKRKIPGIDLTSVCNMLLDPNHAANKKLSHEMRAKLLQGVVVIARIQDEILEANWKAMVQAMKKAITIDSMEKTSMLKSSIDDFPDLGLYDAPLVPLVDDDHLINAKHNAVTNAKLITMEEPPDVPVNYDNTDFGVISFEDNDVDMEFGCRESSQEGGNFVEMLGMMWGTELKDTESQFPIIQEEDEQNTVGDGIIKTPVKRKTPAPDDDQNVTPSKRLRPSRNLQFDTCSPLHGSLNDLTADPVDQPSDDIPNDDEPLATPIDVDTIEQPAAPNDADDTPVDPSELISLGNLDLNDSPKAPRKKRSVRIFNAATCISKKKFANALNTLCIHTTKRENRIVDPFMVQNRCEKLMINSTSKWNPTRLIKVHPHMEFIFSKEWDELKMQRMALRQARQESPVRRASLQEQPGPVSSIIEPVNEEINNTAAIGGWTEESETLTVLKPLTSVASPSVQRTEHQEQLEQHLEQLDIPLQNASDELEPTMTEAPSDDELDLINYDLSNLSFKYLDIDKMEFKKAGQTNYYQLTVEQLDVMADQGLLPTTFEDLCPLNITTQAQSLSTFGALLRITGEREQKHEMVQSKTDALLDRIWIMPIQDFDVNVSSASTS